MDGDGLTGAKEVDTAGGGHDPGQKKGVDNYHHIFAFYFKSGILSKILNDGGNQALT